MLEKKDFPTFRVTWDPISDSTRVKTGQKNEKEINR
jgi:hypothetical protein